MTATDRDDERYKAAMLKILEAKAHLWIMASFGATVLVLLGVVGLIALAFKLVFG